MTLMRLKRIRWAVRAVLVLGLTASTVANILHARPEFISQAISAWPVVALYLTIEVISRVPMGRRSLAAARLVATAVIAGIAAWVSYWHMTAVASKFGETGASPYLLPLSVDGLIVVASICLVELGGRIHNTETDAEVAQPNTTAPTILSAKAPVFLPPVSAPPAPVEVPVSGAPAADESAGAKVRQDTRSAQQIEDAVRAMKAADPRLSQRKIAEAVMVPATTVRRILQTEPTPVLVQLETVNGRAPELVGDPS